jgi:hypothetical protein
MNEKDKNTERIKELLRQKLAAQEQAEDGWNQPSGKVWEGLSQELESNRAVGKKSLLTYLSAALALALLLILCMRECGHQQQMGILKNQLDSAQDSLNILKDECLQKQATPATGEVSGQPSFGNALPSPALPAPGKTFLPFSSANHTRNAYPGLPVLQTKNPSLNGTPANGADQEAAQFFNNKEIAVSEAESGGRPDVSVPDLVDYPALSLIANNTNQPKLHLPDQHSHPAMQWYASLKAGLSFVGSQLEGNPPAIIKGEKPLAAFRTGVGLEAAFSKNWSIETGLDYLVSSTQTDYSLQVPYTHQNEYQHDDGNYDNVYNHSLPSPLGNYPAQLILTRESSASVAEGELMNLDLSIQQRIQLLSLPLMLKFAFGKAPLRFGVKSGLRTNLALGIESEYSSLVSHHSAIHQRHTSIGKPSLSELQRVTFGYSFGFDVNYQLNQRWGLFMESAYQRSILPIYKNQEVRSYLRGFELGLGLRLRLQ